MMNRHPGNTLPADCGHTNTFTYYGYSNENEHQNLDGIGIAKGKGLRNEGHAPPPGHVTSKVSPVSIPEHHPQSTPSEVTPQEAAKCRQLA